MKKLETVIHPQQWDEAQAVLRTLNVAATLRQVQTFGRTPPRSEVYRGLPYTLDTTAELEVTFLVRDELLESAVMALAAVIGNSEILVSAVEHPAAHRANAAGQAAALQTAARNRAVLRSTLQRASNSPR
jgi:nitrogen regulatory protein PII